MRTDLYRKGVLLALIVLSFAFYFPLIPTDADRLTIGRLIGFIGLQLIWWQVILGNRQLMHFITKDLVWVNKRHQISGKYGFLVILLHPLLMVGAYGLSLVWPASFASTFDIGVRFGVLGMSILTFIWLSSALLRGRLDWRWWKRLHLTAYILFPVLFLHMVMTGSSIQRLSWLEIWLYTLVTVFWAVLLLRIAGWAGIGKQRYQLIETVEVAKNVTRFRLQPQKRGLAPLTGQFAYLQGWRFGESHPFTVSHYDADSGEISFSIKAVGPYSHRLTGLQPGATVFVDGPYGVFTNELGQTNRPTVVIAGGIGITPFLRHLEQGSVDHLFLGCRTEADIAYRDTIEASRAKACYVLSEQFQRGPRFDTGNIDAALLKLKLDKPLSEYEYYLCGPPPMMKVLHQQLSSEGVQPNQIHQEKFSL